MEPERDGASSQGKCQICLRGATASELAHCAICNKLTCDWCQVHRSNQVFCGRRCAAADFFAEGEEESNLEDS